MKISQIALALLASSSFCAAAETIVPGSAVTAEADIVVSADSAVGLAIRPVEGTLTVSDVKKVKTTLARYSVSGSNVAVRLVNAHPSYPFCTYATGANDNTNKIEVCMNYDALVPSQSLNVNGVRYYKHWVDSNHQLRSGAAANVKVGADTYKVSLEAIQYAP